MSCVGICGWEAEKQQRKEKGVSSSALLSLSLRSLLPREIYRTKDLLFGFLISIVGYRGCFTHRARETECFGGVDVSGQAKGPSPLRKESSSARRFLPSQPLRPQQKMKFTPFLAQAFTFALSAFSFWECIISSSAPTKGTGLSSHVDSICSPSHPGDFSPPQPHAPH